MKLSRLNSISQRIFYSTDEYTNGLLNTTKLNSENKNNVKNDVYLKSIDVSHLKHKTLDNHFFTTIKTIIILLVQINLISIFLHINHILLIKFQMMKGIKNNKHRHHKRRCVRYWEKNALKILHIITAVFLSWRSNAQ